MSALTFSEVLDRRIRAGEWSDQKISTFREVLRALEEARWADASELADYFVDEARVCWQLYRQWIADLEGYLLEHGVSTKQLDEVRHHVAEVTRLPEGDLFDRDLEWARFTDHIATVRDNAQGQRAVEAAEIMDVARETWRRTHDRDVDRIYAYMSEVATRLGESAIPDMFERVLAPLFAWRYEKFDIDHHPWDESLEVLMYVACEAMRGHLVGPDRLGDIGFEEFDDRFVLSFDPCGSGGRTVQGDEIEGTGPRMAAPYGWRVSEEPHDWNHFTPGVCLYCSHCIILMEQMPIDRFGYPARVVDPPVYVEGDTRRQQCRWTMYKDPTTVPEEFYARAGRSKPTEFGSAAHGGQKVFLGQIDMPGNG